MSGWFYQLLFLISVVTFPSYAEQQFKTLIHKNKNYQAITVRPEKTHLYWKDEQGKPYNNFSRLQNSLQKKHQTAIVMMNAGIYGTDHHPAGLHIENYQQQHGINQRAGKGNFHLQPNGVFYLTGQNKPAVVTTADFLKRFPQASIKHIRLATQSGPMLLINGKINPLFKPESESLYSRNGVCVTKESRLLFFATQGFSRSNFYDFAIAAEQFGCHNALYLDGHLSKLYIKGKNHLFHLGTFVGILAELN